MDGDSKAGRPPGPVMWCANCVNWVHKADAPVVNGSTLGTCMWFYKNAAPPPLDRTAFATTADYVKAIDRRLDERDALARHALASGWCEHHEISVPFKRFSL